MQYGHENFSDVQIDSTPLRNQYYYKMQSPKENGYKSRKHLNFGESS